MSMWRSVKLLMPARSGCGRREVVSGRVARSGALSFGGEEDGFFELVGGNALNPLAKFTRPCTVQFLQSLSRGKWKFVPEISFTNFRNRRTSQKQEHAAPKKKEITDQGAF